MPYLKTAQEWLDHSSQLLQARPTTVRSKIVTIATIITTKYTLKPPTESTQAKENSTAQASATPTRASLTLKTYDPASGVTLKYKTDKGAEVGRLITILSMLGRNMAGLPKLEEDIDMQNSGVDAMKSATESFSTTESGAKNIDGPNGAGSGQGAGGKKSKKKGKR